jgi:outer membrane receptor protein involved in Fe transport
MALKTYGRFLAALLLAGAAGLAAPALAAAQTSGALSGTVTDAASGRPLANVLVTVEQARRGATTDSAGRYRIREVRSGTYTVTTRAIGFRPTRHDGVVVRAGETTIIDVALQAAAVELAPVEVVAADPVLDPLATQTEQRVTAADLRELPVSSVEEALALQAGTVGSSYRGGRLGQESFIIDGLGVKNQLDASTGGLGLRFPPDILTEVALVTNGFSARYGQALSGLVNVVTKDGGERWTGRAAYETDRPFGDGADYGLDRVVLQADGPLLGGIRALVSADVSGRLDAEPLNAPRPDENPLDPRTERPWMLPHNSGEEYNLAGKLTIPMGRQWTSRLFALRTAEQRLLYDPAYKYDPEFGPARKTIGMLLSGHVQHASSPTASIPYVADLRIGYFVRDFLRGQLQGEPEFEVGAFTFDKFHIVGEDLARGQDTAAARAPITGFAAPSMSENTPYGVPAFFLGGGSRGELAWNQFRELRGQLDATIGLGSRGDLYVGGELVRQQVETFQRVLAYLPAGDSVPGATAGDFDPMSAAAYAEAQFRLGDLGITTGLRWDRFDNRIDLVDSAGRRPGAQQRLNPRIGVSTVLSGATVVASIGSFSQAPDYQYLVDAAFDDTLRTGRFRAGNPNLGFERSWQYELSVRARPREGLSLRVNAFVKRLHGLVASVPLGTSPDSSIFGNADAGTVKGGELIFERELRRGWGFRANYTLQEAMATSTSGFLLRRAIRIDPLTGDTIIPAKVEFPLDYDRRHNLTLVLQGQVSDSGGPRLLGIRPLAGMSAAVIGRYSSGLPYTRLAEGDTLISLPNGARLPSAQSLDLLIRRPLDLAGLHGGVYLDVRNVLNRRNIVAVRRDTGQPFVEDETLDLMAERAYDAHPEPIPYESPRYRAAADADGNGYVEGDELRALYRAAAQDFSQPLFAYGAPRMVRLGVEVLF